MATETRYTVIHSCGHSGQYDLSARPSSERAGFARWLASTICDDCWRPADPDGQSGRDR